MTYGCHTPAAALLLNAILSTSLFSVDGNGVMVEHRREHGFVLLPRGDQAFGVAFRHRNRLFGQRRDAAPKRRDALRGVEKVRRGDHNRIYRARFKHRLEVGEARSR